MQCNCGSSVFSPHKVQHKSETIAEYQSCKSCGRIEWDYGKDVSDHLDREAEKKRLIKTQKEEAKQAEKDLLKQEAPVVLPDVNNELF